ncbi:MAG: DUF3467 domain-containing protein [Armatimonadota bacterium]
MTTEKTATSAPEGMTVMQEEASLEGAPTMFANGCQLMAQLYGFQLVFTLKNGPKERPQAVANVHLSPQLAKVVGRLIRQHILAFESRLGSISVPDAVLDELKIRELEE